MSTDFQHCAYLAARKALRDARLEAVTTLQSDCPEADDDSCLPAIAQAMGLCFMAQRLAAQMQQIHDFTPLIDQLRRRCPGYSEETYQQAATHAYVDFIR